MTTSADRVLGIIAGNGRYPFLMAESARAQGVERLVVAGFKDETDPALEKQVDEFAWLRVGQLKKLCDFFQKHGVERAVMAGQIAPGNLFSLRPDLKTILLLARLKERNADSIFSAIADELQKAGVTLLPATTHLENHLPDEGLIAGPKLSTQAQADVTYGFRIAKECSRLDIGQSVVVKNGSVLAVEAFEGTDAAMRRGGALGKGGAVLVKVSKPRQDLRFDVPVIGARTLETAAEAGVSVVACEAKKTLLLDKEKIKEIATRKKISVVAISLEMKNHL
jgi:DUF1009 family protein